MSGCACAIVLALGVGAAAADDADAPVATAAACPALTPEDREFVAAAAQTGLLQVRAGERVVGRSSKSDVRTLAEQSVLGHALANERLRTIALAHGLPWPEDLDVPHRAQLAALESLEEPQFDARYVRDAGILAHEQAVRLYERGAGSGAADLRHFAEETLPLLRAQLRHARRIEDDGFARRISVR